MDFEIVLMPAARDDLEEISEYIAKDDGLAAERFMNDLVDKTLPLAQFPQMGRVVPEFGDSEIREILLNPYRIVYRIRPLIRQIHILRFWHAARGEPFI